MVEESALGSELCDVGVEPRGGDRRQRRIEQLVAHGGAGGVGALDGDRGRYGADRLSIAAGVRHVGVGEVRPSFAGVQQGSQKIEVGLVADLDRPKRVTETVLRHDSLTGCGRGIEVSEIHPEVHAPSRGLGECVQARQVSGRDLFAVGPGRSGGRGVGHPRSVVDLVGAETHGAGAEIHQ